MNVDPHIPTFREVGIACVDTSIKNFGPMVITQDFGTPADASAAFVTGVVYQDSNGNGTYDEGEGLAGVTVTPAAGDYYAVTCSSGGYVLPLPANGVGTLGLTASGGALGAGRSKAVAYMAGSNAKLDFTTADAGATLPVVTVATIVKKAIPTKQAGQIVVSRAGDTTKALQVALDYSGNAVNGVDCSALPTKVKIPAGQSSIALDVQPTAIQRPAGVKLKVSVSAMSTYQIGTDPSRTLAKVRILPVP